MKPSCTVLDEFEQLTAALLDGTATPSERTRFNAISKEYPEFRSVWLEQVRLHALLACRGGGRSAVKAGLIPPKAKGEDEDRRTRAVSSQVGLWHAQTVTKKRSRWGLRKVAAAVAVLLGGAAVWYEGALPRESTAVLPVAPVLIVGQTGVKGLDLPESLPGLLRLSSGEAVVKLESGVELTVIGPVEVAVRDCMQVRLERGRLLVNVPHWATGFTVRTAELEVYDLGTIFSVSVTAGVSEVFVFKGSVQVNEAGYGEEGRTVSGSGVGVCEAGEGVRAVSGETPSKISLDGAEAEKLFGAVCAGRALETPAKALETATRIVDLWADRYTPGANLVVKTVKIGNGIPFQKTPWVRSSAPQQEGSNMNRASAAAVLTAATMMAGAGTSVAMSDRVLVDTSPCHNRHWTTVYTNEVPLSWDWVATATQAELEITGMNTSFTTNFTMVTSNYLWRVFSASVPSSEDAYDLRLTFYDRNALAVGSLTSRLAVVTGAFGKAAVDPGPSDRTWTTVRDNVVIPYDASWAAATADAIASQFVIAKTGGSTQTNMLADASGYTGWKLRNSGWGYGTFNLALTFPDAEGKWDATLAYVPVGTLISVR